LRIRLCEERFVEPILEGEIRCPVHLYSGQEAIAAGVCAALRADDVVFGNHRSHGHYLAKGGDLGELVSEVFCREDGCARGRGGSMHVLSTGVGMMGAAPIVAGTISLALGAAVACAIRDDGCVAVSFFGDGAVGEGVLYESLNFAAVRRLPLLFVCENNLYSTHLRIDDIRPNEDIRRIAEPFDIFSERIDGNNAVEVFEVAQDAVERCRTGRGPVFLECLTYRQRGHVGPDDNIQGSHTDIRPKAEINAWVDRDPIRNMEVALGEVGLPAGRLDEIRREIIDEVESAFASAREAVYPSKEGLADHVFKS